MHQAIPFFIVASALLALAISIIPGTAACGDDREETTVAAKGEESSPSERPSMESDWVKI